MKPTTRTVLHERSWRVATPEVEAWLTHAGGHLGPVTFSFGRGRKLAPLHVAPWHGETLPRGTPPILRALRGDFFCLPFGGNGTPFGKERHPVHGEPANGRWKLESFVQDRSGTRLHASLKTRVRPGRVDKHVVLRRGHRAVYQRHVVSAMSGPMCFGHHAMLAFPEPEGSGVISTSPFRFASTFTEPTERPENRGYSVLQPGVAFEALDRVPLVTGGTTDLSRYPARRGYEDIAILCADTSVPFAWTAVVFAARRYVWFAMKDPKVLASTLMWFSNGGRHYAPWSGRHVNVLGLEEVTSAFHPGLAESVAENVLSRRGVRTSVTLDPDRPLVVNYLFGVADCPAGFDRVAEILPAGADAVTLVSHTGTRMDVAIDLSWLRGDA